VRCFVGIFGGIVRKRKDEQWLYRTERLSFSEATRLIWEGAERSSSSKRCC
jgi:hypothetical protein